MTAPVILESGALLRAVVLVAIAAGVSVALRLDLERRMLWAAVRATVQLFLVGEILSTLFNNPWAPATFLAMAVMIGAATHQTIVRPERRLPGGGLGAFITLALTGLLTTWIVARGVIGVVPWYTPQYAIPLLGMILGNGLTGMALTLDRMTAAAHEHRARIEADLALGASRFEAMRGPMVSAARVGVTPIVNATTVVGLVAIPGVLTGQILSGVDPAQAVRYQLLVMFMVMASTSLGVSCLAAYAVVRLTDSEHRLRPTR